MQSLGFSVINPPAKGRSCSLATGKCEAHEGNAAVLVRGHPLQEFSLGERQCRNWTSRRATVSPHRTCYDFWAIMSVFEVAGRTPAF